MCDGNLLHFRHMLDRSERAGVSYAHAVSTFDALSDVDIEGRVLPGVVVERVGGLGDGAECGPEHEHADGERHEDLLRGTPRW